MSDETARGCLQDSYPFARAPDGAPGGGGGGLNVQALKSVPEEDAGPTRLGGMTLRKRTFVPLPALALALVSLTPCPAEAQQALTFEQARTAMDAAEAEARRNGWNLTILVADADGVPIYLRRMAGASTRSYEIAMAKVRTALAAGMATGDYGQALAAGRADTIPNGITFEGGYPVRMGGQIVGAMSASGARGSEDAQAVRAGLAAIGVTP